MKKPRLVFTIVCLFVGNSFALVVGPSFTLRELAAPAAFARQEEPVTLFLNVRADMQTLDPQRAQDPMSAWAIQSLFLGLTDVDPRTNQIVPGLASSWTVSDDGLVWTFSLRDHVSWVRWHPESSEAEILRPVTAHDAAYAIKRVCDPRLETYYTTVAAQIIRGCDSLASLPLDQVSDADFDLVQVHALDDHTLEVHLRYPAGFFLTMTPMWIFSPVPREIIEEHGEDWTQLGTLVTNGPFMMDTWIPGEKHVLVRNVALPVDLRGPGNVERVVATVMRDPAAILAAYRIGQLDTTSWLLAGEVVGILGNDAFAGQIDLAFDMAVLYLGFAHDKAPFDNVHVRRAFAASIDRQAVADNIGFGTPMIHFTPPGVFGAPPVDAVGVGFDPAYAREQLALAGYPGCEGLPPIEVLTVPIQSLLAESLVAGATQILGCESGLIQIEVLEEDIYPRIAPDLAPEDRPHVWTLGWGSDYPDANNWVGDALRCSAANSLNRPCTEVDDLIDQAAAEVDPRVRTDLYRDIEERLFGPAGEHPIAALWMSSHYFLHAPWVDGPFQAEHTFDNVHFDWYTIDQTAQLAARRQ